MLGCLVLVVFLLSGVFQMNALCTERAPVTRLWLGLVWGFVEMMWLPSLFAFWLDFTLGAQLCALGVSVILGVVGFISRPTAADTYAAPSFKAVLIIALLLTPLIAYLQYTHNLRPVDGSLHCGQSTYGDLCMHMSFASGLIGQSYPAEYSLLPGTLLGYPYLVDALSATMMIFGTDISTAFALPGTLMTLLIYLGFFMLAYEITKKYSAAILALLLLLCSGGLGFLYTLDLSGTTGFSELLNALYGYYQAPANNPELNLRWVNALCDLIIPQRALMAGWMVLIPGLYLLFTALKSRRTRDFAALGAWAGPMVMIHTHSFLGLGVVSLGVMIDTLIRDKGHRLMDFANFAVYGILACIIALPQLLVWTFPQTIEGGSLRILFNWVNNDNGTLKDGYFWFWLKNVGPMFLLFPLAALTLKSHRIKAFSLGALLLFVLAEIVLFQPNVYDNIKLFYVAYIVMLPAGCLLLVEIYNRLKGIRLRALLAAAFIFVCTASGVISIARECISDYELFSASAVDAAEFIKENTEQDAVILTSNNHNNAVASLTGRKIVCGSSLYLYFHGLDYSQQESDMRKMLSDPAGNLDLYEQYGIDYVYISAYEANECGADYAVFDELFEKLYEDGAWYDTIRIYKVTDF